MTSSNIPFSAIRSLCLRRIVDLVLAEPPRPYVLRLLGQFDGTGDFFSILARGVAHVDVTPGLTIRDIDLTDPAHAVTLAPRWHRLRNQYDGSALVIRSGDAPDWRSATDDELHIVIADELVCLAGGDWELVHRHLAPDDAG
jgi:hypothetical protein